VAVASFRGLLHARPDEVSRTVTEPLTTSMRCRTGRELRATGASLPTAAYGRRISLKSAEGHAWIAKGGMR
jgi:hypothetical protein